MLVGTLESIFKMNLLKYFLYCSRHSLFFVCETKKMNLTGVQGRSGFMAALSAGIYRQ